MDLLKNVELHMKILGEYEQHKLMQANTQLRKGQRPMGRKPRSTLEMAFLSRQSGPHDGTDDKFVIRTTSLPAAYLPCIRPLEKLKKVMIDQLVLETHHRRTYLLLRTTTPTEHGSPISSFRAVVQDETGDGIMLQLYNQVEPNDKRDGSAILPIGTVLIVKEPYLEMTSDGEFGVRVDHPSDVMFLSETNGRVPLAWRAPVGSLPCSTFLKMQGNDLMGQTKYYEATECYTKALESSLNAEEVGILHLNRSLAFVKTGRFDAALRDLDQFEQAAPFDEKLKEKGLFRNALALYGLGKFRECSDILAAVSSASPSNTAARGELRRCIARLREQRCGLYNFRQMYKDAAKLQPPLLDVATHIGPVSLRDTGSKGKGLFTTEHVKAGDILLCEKAFSFWFKDVKARTRGSQTVLLICAEMDLMDFSGQAQNLHVMVRKLFNNPSLLPVINGLSHGTYEPVGVLEVDGGPVVDTFMAHRIIALNGYGSPPTSLSKHRDMVESYTGEARPVDLEDEITTSSGVWPMASYINHSCMSNCHRTNIGDTLIIRASCDMPADTELAVWYRVPDMKLDQFKFWGFTCQCAICQDLKGTTAAVLKRRRTLRGEALDLLDAPSSRATARVEKIVAAMAVTYSRPPTEVPRLLLWDLQLSLAHAYPKQLKETVDMALQSMESLGFVIEGAGLPHVKGTTIVIKKWGLVLDRLILGWVLLAHAYRRSEAPALESQAWQYAKTMYKICVGEDETFLETYDELL